MLAISTRIRVVRRSAAAGLFLVGVCAAVGFAQNVAKNVAVFLEFEDARHVLELLPALPPELKPRESQAAVWPDWVIRSDAQTRARLTRGDEDSLVNLLLFGTGFTRQPRMTARQIEEVIAGADPTTAGSTLDAITDGRLNDFMAGVANPRGNERLVYAAQVLAAKGLSSAFPAGRTLLKAYLLGELGRVLKEIDANARVIERARQSGLPGAEFAERSRLYRARGLSSDTSLLPNFAIEEALRAMRAKGALVGRIARVAVIGPGLDFADKQEGYDFYPQQTLQPFAILDSLFRLGLADPRDVRVTTFDVSPKVNAHLARLHDRSMRGEAYVLQLPLASDEGWTAGFLEYWQRFGDRIGNPVAPAAVPPAVGRLKLRAVAVRPAVALRVTPIDLNIVLQRIDLAPDERFDLIVGTNILLYYDEFQQALAMINIEKMLRPGGVLLSNNALVELPGSPMRWVGDTTIAYSEKDNGDTVVWYRKTP